MQNRRSDPGKTELRLTVISPDTEPVSVFCDSVHLCQSDTRSGRGGGSYGVHRGHAKAVLALGEGQITAYLGGTLVFCCEAGSGFARIFPDHVTAVVENLRLISDK